MDASYMRVELISSHRAGADGFVNWCAEYHLHKVEDSISAGDETPITIHVHAIRRVMWYKYLQIRSLLRCRLTPHVLSFTRGSSLFAARTPYSLQPCSPSLRPIQQRLHGPVIPKITALVNYSDVSTQKYTMIYTLPYIKLLRAVSRLKLLQTAITVVLLPPVYVLYFQGAASAFLVGYTTGIALFAGVMLYTASYFFRRVVGMMYLDPSQTTLKVSHLTFWGKRHDMYLPVSDVMTIGDTGDSVNETILKFKRYSSAETLYFSTHFGRVVDEQAFKKVFGSF